MSKIGSLKFVKIGSGWVCTKPTKYRTNHPHSQKKIEGGKKQTKKNLPIECDNQFSHSLFRKHKEKTQ